MKITMSGKGFEISDSLRERVEKKLAKLDRYFREDVEANVRVAQEKGNRNIVEITIAVNGLILRAEETSGDMYASIDGAADKLNRQIRRYRTKLEKRLRETAMEGLDAEAAQAEDEPAAYNVVRTKKCPDGIAGSRFLPVPGRGDRRHLRDLSPQRRRLWTASARIKSKTYSAGRAKGLPRIFYGNLLARRGVFIYNIMWMFGWRLMAWSRETPAGPLR